MTDDDNAGSGAQAIARQNRLRDALRENLKRRKSQSRGRAGQATEDPVADSSPGPHIRARRVDPDHE
jgi:hypothetical protein